MLQLREYQQRSLDELSKYFKETCKYGAKRAFIAQTERPYRSVPSLAEMPYVCLRVPTGGGKTLMASYALGTATRDYLQAEHTVCLWLVPSNVIRDQTLVALRDRRHPYRQAVDAHFAGNVRVIDLQEALYVQRGTLDGETTIIVSTLAALRVEDTNGRKVYETAGALQHHFTGLSPALRELLETEGGQIVYSLANVLRLHRPIVIMDEAHNARTRLSFDTLTRFNPSCVIEFTATPVTTHKPEQGCFASNVLYHVSARELKEAEMIKLPIKLRTRPDWREVIADALQQQRELEKIAIEEQKESGEYIRPIILFQAQPQSQERSTLNVSTVKQALIDDFRVPAEQIAVATGDTREIDDIDLFDPACQIRFIITVQALKEGWDCSFAYILCSVAEQHSARSVEQLLGRVLRMPRASRKNKPELNCAYAFAASGSFIETAHSLKDGLLENGFERMEAEDLVTPQDTVELSLFGSDGHNLFSQAAEVMTEHLDLSNLPAAIAQHVTFDPSSNLLTVQGALSEPEMIELQSCFTHEKDRVTVERMYHRLQGRTVVPSVLAREPFSVPGLAVCINGELELFDDSHFLDFVWNLSECDASLSEGEFPSTLVAGAAGEIDVSQSGQVETRFVDQLHDQLTMISLEPGWTIAGFANWLDRQIPHPDITQAQSSLFIQRVVTNLISTRNVSLKHLARLKFRLRNAVATKINEYRDQQRKTCYEKTLFGQDHVELMVEPGCCFIYDEDRYSPNWYYEGGWRFNKHYLRLIGELKAEGEEFECARVLDGLPQVKHWVRNLERRPESSFWLQTSTDKFYPDFVAELVDGRYLVVEYKGEDRWSNDDSRAKRALGGLWEERSDGKCIFVMPKGRDLTAIVDAIK
ncbi:MAG: DEAD/DEAH box helicase family protein [bacterium]|nr:DEAD/DEAH box helicase family protein [bacterium]